MQKKDEFELMPVGVLARVAEKTPTEIFDEVTSLGLKYCQFGSIQEDFFIQGNTHKFIAEYKHAIQGSGINVTALFIPFPNQNWNYPYDTETIGLVSEKTRCERMIRVCTVSNIANELEIPALLSHVGYIPDNINTDFYKKFISDMHSIVEFCARNGQTFNFETGQESLDVLEHTLNAIDHPFAGINLDPANMLMYDRAHPLELVKRLGHRIKSVHCKDGIRPEMHGTLGMEKKFGEGDVCVEKLIRALYRCGYKNCLTIERETEGLQRTIDIRETTKFIQEIKQKILRSNSFRHLMCQINFPGENA